jgi:starch phosphorylase
LKDINKRGRLQLVFTGKAHPRDEAGKRIIKEIYNYRSQLQGDINVVYLENYNMDLAGRLTSGVDVWLNTPLPPNEASGTSGMKAAYNDVINLSILDGWWIEGCIEGVTGWAIGSKPNELIGDGERRVRELKDLYNKLDNTWSGEFKGFQDTYDIWNTQFPALQTLDYFSIRQE